MCSHTDIELIAELRDAKKDEIIELYTCKNCKQTLVKNGRKKPVPAIPELLK